MCRVEKSYLARFHYVHRNPVKHGRVLTADRNAGNAIMFKFFNKRLLQEPHAGEVAACEFIAAVRVKVLGV